MQRKMTGPGGAILYDFDPPYRPWSDNQSTYLFFPVFITFVLSLISTLSAPIIQGLGAVKLDFHGDVSMVIGTWGWCANAFANATCDQIGGCPVGMNNIAAHVCSGKRPFGRGMDEMLVALPKSLAVFGAISQAVPKTQLDAAGALQIISVIVNWLALLWTLAASGEWESKRKSGWKWTRWAFGGNIASGVFLLVQWALTLATFTSYQKQVKKLGLQELVKVKPGGSIFMLMVGMILTLGTFITRLLWSRRQPRPLWSMKDHAPINAVGGTYRRSLEDVNGKFRVSDPAGPAVANTIFASPSQGGTPEGEELPPTWDSLGISAQESLARGEKPEHGIV